MIIYNSLSKKKEKLKSIKESSLKIYSCGPTVYNYAHIGNLRTYIMQDLFIKTFLALGYEVKTVMNITDVGHLTGDSDYGEDKMLVAAREAKMRVKDLALFYEDKFFQDCEKLNILRANYTPRVTENMDKIISFIEKIENAGFTYQNENLYFETEKYKAYGKMSNLYKSKEEQARVEKDKLKKSQRDFGLWFTKSKFENHILTWDSKWGCGYPGWHVECSALSYEFLGEHFDIHFGGIDHISTHHTNEIAQSECALGIKNWVNYFVHMEFLLMKNKKVSKSDRSFLTLDKLVEMGFSALEYRYFCISSHYRKQLTFTTENMINAKNTYTSIINLILNIPECIEFAKNETKVYKDFDNFNLSSEGKSYLTLFYDALSDDLNTPKALSVLFQILNSNLKGKDKLVLLIEMDKVFSLSLFESVLKKYNYNSNIKISPEEKLMLEKRIEYKKNKNFEEADKIREYFKNKGIALIDKGNTIILERI